MLRGIEFNHERFDKNNENNRFVGLTNNTIVICNNFSLMDRLAKEIVDTVNGWAEYNDYDCDDDDTGSAKIILNFGLQKVVDICGQRITLCLEPAMVYAATTMEDIWFCDCHGVDNSYNEIIYPMSVFRESRAVFNSGLENIYKMVVGGRYGAYDGKWVCKET